MRFFDPEMDRRLRERYALQHDLRSAVAHGELALYYQPQAKIDVEVFGLEALLRWQHPKHGLVPRTTFIALAEQNGMIGEIGEWTLREVCREAASWTTPLQIGINLSPMLRYGDLASLVRAILLETGLAPGRLELEITEGVPINDPPRALSILRLLKLLGVKIAMDDFGTGCASLSLLQSFPFDKIKIDRTFVAGVDHNGQSHAIVRGHRPRQGFQYPGDRRGCGDRRQTHVLEERRLCRDPGIRHRLSTASHGGSRPVVEVAE